MGRRPSATSALAVLAACVAVAGTAAPSMAAPDPALGAVAADGRLTVLYMKDAGPFLGVDEQGPRGFDYDVLQGFAERHGVTLEVIEVPATDQLVPALLAGRGEVVAGGFTRTPERASEALFTGPVTPQRHVVVSRAPDPTVTTLEQLRRLRVGTAGGTSWEVATRATGVPDAQIDASYRLAGNGLLEALQAKKVDVAVTGLFYALGLSRQDPAVRMGLLLGEPGHHGYAVRPQDDALRRALDDYLTGVRDTAGWYRIVIKHFGKEAPELFRRAKAEG
jgi:ABC-type amino acid transport substrate-binding protein